MIQLQVKALQDPNISVTPFNQLSPRPPEEGCFELSQTHRHTDRQTDIATLLLIRPSSGQIQ